LHTFEAPEPDGLGAVADVASYELQTGQVLGDDATFEFPEWEPGHCALRPTAFLPDEQVALLAL
jgi:hypothetical protein